MNQRPTIAILGASTNRAKFGNKAVRAYLLKGYEVYPVHPKEEVIEGLKAFPSVCEIPVPKLDRVSIYLPPALGLQVIDEVAKKPATEVWFNPGADNPDLLNKAKTLRINVVTGCSIVDIGVNPADLV